MVGLSDIPCVGKIVDRISDATVDPLFRGCGYLFCYKDRVNNLNSNIEKLTNQEDELSRKIDAGKADGKIIYDNVAKWKTKVEEFQKSAKEFEEKYKNRSSWRCIQCLPIPKPVSRFQLGREAEHMAKQVTALIDSGKDYLVREIAHLPQVENLPNTSDVFQDFRSREDAYKKLWEALVTEDSSMILGIYGMPGVGKTRMMEQIWKEAKDKKIFDKVTRADVGNENLDVIKIQNQIAGHLDCHLESQDNEERRASQLKNRLMNGDKILVILDDVWREIPLHRIGIPLGDGSSSKGCKILFTSRQEDVCLVNNCMHPVKITPLTINEAWDMFSTTVGTNIIDSLQDESLARKVCEKCAGLPLLIRAVGKALQFTSHNSWKDALGQLEKGKVENIAGLDPQVYACVELSIDRLPDDAKSCLFLCSLYPEDAHIYIRKLIQLATSSLVPDGEARICAMVDNLRSSSLLLDSEEDYIIKFHDLIRDVARFIAVRDPKYAFSLVRCDSRLPDNADYSTRKLLHLHLEKDAFRFPDDLVFPDLHNLWLQCNKHIQQFSGGFSGMFVNLKFLLIEGMLSSLALQFSLQPLGKLRTLILDHCDLTHIDQTKVSLFPQNLETLCIWDCHLPVPLDLSNLKNLQKLEIEGGETEVQLVPNTISNMPCLKELHIWPDGFKIWNDGSEISQDAVSASILVEISKLTGLKSLGMFFKDSEPFQETNIFGSLLQFNIRVGKPVSYYDPDRSVSIKKSIELEILTLQGLEDTVSDIWGKYYYNDSDNNNNIVSSSFSSSFCKLKTLWVENCNKLETVIPLGMLHSLRNLERLTISYCNGLRNVFQHSSIARDLIHLKTFKVWRCKMMREIIGGEADEQETTAAIIVFPELTYIYLIDLPNLSRFWRYKVHFPNLERIDIVNCGKIDLEAIELGRDDSTWQLRSLGIRCDKEIQLPYKWLLRLYNPKYLTLEHCWPHHLKSLCFQRLKELTVHNSGCLTLFTFSAFKSLQQLQQLEISNSDLLEGIVEDVRSDEASDMDKKTVLVFQLKSVELNDLPNLKCFFQGANYECHMPALIRVKIDNCGLSSLFTFSAFGSLQQLKELEISNCALLKDIAEDVGGDEASGMDKKTITLFQLKKVTLKDLPNLKCFLQGANYKCHMPALTKVELNSCGLSTLFTCSVFGKLQQLEALEVSNCRLLEGIVEDGRDDETSIRNDKIITLSQLASVVLRDLPNLKSFSSTSSYAFNMPNLLNFHLLGCPRVENFTSLKTSTKLVYVHTEWHQGEKFPDLNDYITQNHKRGSNLIHSAGESSYSIQELETESERVGEQQLQETEENDQP